MIQKVPLLKFMFQFNIIFKSNYIAGVIAICGGNTGSTISNKFYMIAYKSTKIKS